MSDAIISDSFFHHLLMEIFDQLTKSLNGIKNNLGDAFIFQADYFIAKNIFNQLNFKSFWVLVALVFGIYEPSYYLYHKKYIKIKNILVWKPWALNLFLITFFVFLVDKLKVFRFFTRKTAKIDYFVEDLTQSLADKLIFNQEIRDFFEGAVVFSGKILYAPLYIDSPAAGLWDDLKSAAHMYDNSTVPAVFNPKDPNQNGPVLYEDFYNSEPELRNSIIQHNLKTFAYKPMQIYYLKSLDLYTSSLQYVDHVFRRFGPYAAVSKWFANAYNGISLIFNSYKVLANSETSSAGKVLDLTITNLNALWDIMLINNPVANVAVIAVDSKTLYDKFVDWKLGGWEFWQQARVFMNAMRTMRPYYYAELRNNTALALENEKDRLEQEKRDNAEWYKKIGYMFKDTAADVGKTLYDSFTMSAVDDYFTIEKLSYDTKNGWPLQVDPTDEADVNSYLNYNIELFLEREFPALQNKKKQTKFLPP